MPSCPRSSVAADELDRLVLDVIEFERLAREIVATFEGIDPDACPNQRIAAQLLELLYRTKEIGLKIDTAACRRISTLIASLAEVQGPEKPFDPCRRRAVLASV